MVYIYTRKAVDFNEEVNLFTEILFLISVGTAFQIKATLHNVPFDKTVVEQLQGRIFPNWLVL